MVLPLFSIGQDFTITASDRGHISLHFELGDYSIDTVVVDGEIMHSIVTKGIVVPNEYGLPALPTFNRFIAIPQGAKAIVDVRMSRDEHITGINILPSEGSWCENDPEPPFFKDPKVYSRNSFYPSEACCTAEPQQLRGVDVIHIGLSPFQFNPVTHELAIHRSMDIDIRFEGGNGHFGDDRLRSPYWDPILQNNILNYSSLPSIDYDARRQEWSRNRATGCEYLILTPDNEAFIEAAQELANYRTRQGILTKVMAIGETGSTTPGMLRLWVRAIYANWDIPPVAVCILADHGEDMTHYIPAFRTQSPKDGFISSDNPYADINDDNLPDISFSRLVAQNESELPIFIGKQMEYEYTNPCMNLYYYKHPLTASAWQTTLWFQITISTIYGYLSQHDKFPTRLSEIHSGTLSDQWSSASGTSAITSYFGPTGLGYIPATPGELGEWTGATKDDVIEAFNRGAYIVQHRDHGWTQKWYQPLILVSDFNAINNVGQMPFLISVNCKTGEYDFGSNCFTEALMRMTRDGQNAGIVGAISPSGQTYSFANDIFLWGVWDLFDPSFMPDYGPNASHVAEWIPSFAMVSGKYFLDLLVFPNTEYWTNDPVHPWQIINYGAFDGNYCALSDTTITHDESSSLSFTYTSNEEGTFEFYSRVSSESNYDFLIFYIDDEEKAKWSGTIEWYNHSYTVRPGQHVYTWTYEKDYSVSSGADCAWIDYIFLPPYLDNTAEQNALPLTLYPNPTTDQVSIGLELEGDFIIQVFDANGQCILKEKNLSTLSFKGRPAGMYHIVVQQDGQSWSRRIIKM